MKRIQIAHPRPDTAEQIKMSILRIATAFATSCQQKEPEGNNSIRKWHIDIMGNDWWALVDPTKSGFAITIRHRYRQEMADLLMLAICHKYPHECTFAE